MSPDWPNKCHSNVRHPLHTPCFSLLVPLLISWPLLPHLLAGSIVYVNCVTINSPDVVSNDGTELLADGFDVIDEADGAVAATSTTNTDRLYAADNGDFNRNNNDEDDVTDLDDVMNPSDIDNAKSNGYNVVQPIPYHVPEVVDVDSRARATYRRRALTSSSSSRHRQHVALYRILHDGQIHDVECPVLAVVNGHGHRQFPCPTPDRHKGHFVCIDDSALCDDTPQCPSGEDEDKTVCMFHRLTLDYFNSVLSAMFGLIKSAV